MLEVWQHNDVSDLHKVIRRSMHGRLTWSVNDVMTHIGSRYTRTQVASVIASMITGKHVIRLARGVYRFRGVV